MEKTRIVWLAVAASLVLVGVIVFVSVLAIRSWDLSKLSAGQYQTNTHTVNEGYKNISIVTDTADIAIVPAEGRETSVVCYEQANATHLVTVQDDTLVIQVDDTRKWYEHIGIGFDSPKITVYIPAGEWGAVSVQTVTGVVRIPEQFAFASIHISGTTGSVTNRASALGDIRIHLTTGSIDLEDISAGAMELSVTTGSIEVSDVTCDGKLSVHVSTGETELEDITCGELISTGSTGDVSLEHVKASGKFTITRSTGDVRFDGADAAEIYVKTDTGDVKGSLLTDKVFFATTDTGSVDVPKSMTGGRCEITTDTGDIKITVKNPKR